MTKKIVILIIIVLLLIAGGVFLQTQVQSSQRELNAKEKELNALNEKLEKARLRIEIIKGVFIPALTGELNRITEAEAIKWLFEWQDKIKATGDNILITKFQVFMETKFADEAFADFFIYLLENTSKILER